MNHEEQDDLQGGPEEGGGYSGRYLHIANGKVVERTTADNPKAVKRTPKPNDDGTPRPDVYELIYDSFSGRIEAMFNRERNVPWQTHPLKSTVVVLKAGGELYNLELQHNGRYWPVFMNCLASGAVDLSRGVRIKAWDYKQKGTQKRMVGLGLYQKATAAQVEAASKPDAKIKLQDDGTVQIPWRWTKENPGKQPQPKVHKIPGKDDIWDFSERDEFLRGVVVFFEEKLKAMREAELNELEQAGATAATPEPTPAPTPVTPPKEVVAKADPAGYDPDDEGPPPFDHVPLDDTQDDQLPF